MKDNEFTIIYLIHRKGDNLKLDIINQNTSIVNVVLLTSVYFVACGIMPTTLDIVIWRKLDSNISIWLNLLIILVFNSIFLFALIKKYQLNLNFFKGITVTNLLLAVGCSILFFFLLDKFLDPIFDSMFSTSAEEYQKTLEILRQAPMANFIRICLLAPIVEEILMRGYVLQGLQNRYGVVIALLVSAFLFALLHFNFVQTLSALICGLILGLLYINTGSLFCCILAHSLYNTISYFTTIIR